MSTSVEQPAVQETSLRETFRSRFNELVERFRDRVRSVIESVSETISSFKKSVEANIALAPKDIYVEEGYEADLSELENGFETFFDSGKLSEIYDRFPTGPGGRMYGFGEASYSQPKPLGRLGESRIDSYWNLISADPGSRNLTSMRASFVEEMRDKGINPEELGKMIAAELPTRVAESFREACDLQVQLERALISGASYEEVREIIDKRDGKARLAFLMNGHYRGDGSEKCGWSGKGNSSYKEGMGFLISELETKVNELQSSNGNTGYVTKINLKIKELRAKMDKPVSEFDVYNPEDYKESRTPRGYALDVEADARFREKQARRAGKIIPDSEGASVVTEQAKGNRRRFKQFAEDEKLL